MSRENNNSNTILEYNAIPMVLFTSLMPNASRGSKSGMTPADPYSLSVLYSFSRNGVSNFSVWMLKQSELYGSELPIFIDT